MPSKRRRLAGGGVCRSRGLVTVEGKPSGKVVQPAIRFSTWVFLQLFLVGSFGSTFVFVQLFFVGVVVRFPYFPHYKLHLKQGI